MVSVNTPELVCQRFDRRQMNLDWLYHSRHHMIKIDLCKDGFPLTLLGVPALISKNTDHWIDGLYSLTLSSSRRSAGHLVMIIQSAFLTRSILRRHHKALDSHDNRVLYCLASSFLRHGVGKHRPAIPTEYHKIQDIVNLLVFSATTQEF
jgi:hypothetical protein